MTKKTFFTVKFALAPFVVFWALLAGNATHGAGVEAAVISGACAAHALVPGMLARPGTTSRPDTRLRALQTAPERLASA
jgi:hypothetical protein